jgi:hypothetical protein
MLPLTVLIEIVTFRVNGVALFESNAFFLVSAVPWLAMVVLSGTERFGRVGSTLSFLSLLAGVIATFPEVANHSWLTLTALAVLALVDGRSAEQRLNGALIARVQVATVLFYSGLHKLVSGIWFDGTMLRSMPKLSESIPITILERAFQVLGASSAADAAFTVASNVTWLSELITGLGMLFAPVASLAMWLAIFMLFVIELAAHEFIFGSVMLILVSMSFRTRWIRGLCLLAIGALVCQLFWATIA